MHLIIGILYLKRITLDRIRNKITVLVGYGIFFVSDPKMAANGGRPTGEGLETGVVSVAFS